MKLTKEEFQDLWNIENSWQSDPVKAADGSPESIKKHMKIFLRLDELGYIKVEIRDKSIYGAVLTDKGRKALKDKSYNKWIPE